MKDVYAGLASYSRLTPANVRYPTFFTLALLYCPGGRSLRYSAVAVLLLWPMADTAATLGRYGIATILLILSDPSNRRRSTKHGLLSPCGKR